MISRPVFNDPGSSQGNALLQPDMSEIQWEMLEGVPALVQDEKQSWHR